METQECSQVDVHSVTPFVLKAKEQVLDQFNLPV